MSYEFDHLHIKAKDPAKTVEWYVKAFDFKVVGDTVRGSGDRFISCRTPDGTTVNFSSARIGETLGQGDAGVHWGIEHFALKVDDLDADIESLKNLGAVLLEGPILFHNGVRTVFIEAPDNVRIQLLQLSNA